MASLPHGATKSAGGIVYSPVGSCIYCGNDQNPSREHIIPFGLHGELVLPKASCKRHRDLTSNFEGIVLKEIFGIIRARYGLRTSNSRKRHKPSSLSAFRENEDGTETEFVFKRNELPFHTWFLPLFGYPGVIGDVDFRQMTSGIRLASRIGDYDAQTALRITGGKRPVRISAKVNIPAFAQFIAKMAHAFAVANLGCGELQSLLIPLIDGDVDRFRDFVGGEPECEPPAN